MAFLLHDFHAKLLDASADQELIWGWYYNFGTRNFGVQIQNR